ncbi:hypothetical protein HN873_002317, partial [Arachis hypogaea]
KTLPFCVRVNPNSLCPSHNRTCLLPHPQFSFSTSLPLSSRVRESERHRERLNAITIRPAVSTVLPSAPSRFNFVIHSSKNYSAPCVQMDMERVLALDFDIKDILFFCSKNALTERLLDIGLRFTHSKLRRLLSRISYYFSNGPFLRFWIKKGYDTRKDPDSRMYDLLLICKFLSIFYIVLCVVFSFLKAFVLFRLKLRWEEICTFRAFPYKLQTSLQLFELVDDYIQSEINKPPSQASCTISF